MQIYEDTSFAFALSLACSGSSVFARLFAARRSNSLSCSSCLLRSTLSKSSKNFNCALTSCVTSYRGSTYKRYVPFALQLFRFYRVYYSFYTAPLSSLSCARRLPLIFLLNSLTFLVRRAISTLQLLD